MATKTGTAAANVLNSTAVADRLLGLGGNDTLNGGGGNDTLEGGTGNDRLVGGTGNDVYVFGANNGTDTIVEAAGAGGGIDTVRSSVTVNSLANNVENLVLTGTNAINGTGNTLANKITGNTKNNKLSGLAGNDTIDGGSGNDSLNGGDGNDRLIGGIGNDTMVGGKGNDTFDVNSAADKVSEATGTGSGIDTVNSTVTWSLNVAGNTAVENLTLGAGAINGTGNTLANTITGGTGNNTLSGLGGNDKLSGGNGADTLDGGAGGADTLLGGAGNDVLIWDATDTVRDGGTDIDTLRVTGTSAMNLASEPIANMEIVDLAGTNTLTLTAAHILSGFTNDTLTLNGGTGDAVVAGSGWIQLGNDGGYAVYEKDGATLKVDLDVDRSGIGVAEIALSGLDGAAGFRISGKFADLSGRSVSDAGDVNGDGFDDLVIGAPYDSGDIYVVFGSATGFASNFDASSLDGTNGFALTGAGGTNEVGSLVSAAGDVNGDGYGDIVIGLDPSFNGYSWVVLGGSSFDPSIALASLDGATGFRITGAEFGDATGRSAGGAGDVNGDGYGDFIIGASGPLNANGAAYVVFGTAGGFAPEFDLSALDGANGFKLAGSASERAGFSVAGAGDVNGDGLDDVIVGAFYADPNGVNNAGATYVVFGSAAGFLSSLELSQLDGTSGFRIAGEEAVGYLGNSVAAAGDVNGDGYGDVIVGAYFTDRGASYVVFGTGTGFASSVDLSAMNGTNGFRIEGVADNDQAGFSVSGAGDVNGDGYDDIIIGARLANGNELVDAGASYVVFGAASGFGATLELSSLDGVNGWTIHGEATQDRLGTSVSAAGDVNGDGYADLIAGAFFASPNGQTTAGLSYVVFGRDYTDEVDFLGGSGADTMQGTSGAEIFVGGRGDDTMIGGGGDDAFHGGEGNDRIVLGAGDPLRVDGGSGMDTVAVDGFGASIVLDGTDASVQGIEKVDLEGTAANTLVLTRAGVLATSDTSNILRVIGDEDGDAVTLLGDWQLGPLAGEIYDYWYSGNAQVRIEQGVTVYTSSMSLSALDGDNGFRLDGANANDYSGWSVASAGDVDGDGFDDVIVGAFGVNTYAGAAYVVFGDASAPASTLELSALNGTNGFRLSGVDSGDRAGYSVASAGDVNGDGIADLIVGAPRADGNTFPWAGETYVVFGSATGYAAVINLSTLNGTNGFRLDGSDDNDQAGYSAASAGDVNGDGYGDLVIGATDADPGGKSLAGEAYVVFGGSTFGSALALSSLDGATGFRLEGTVPEDHVGKSVASAGDLNGDGYDEVIFGAWGANGQAGQTYVVYGHSGAYAPVLATSALDGTNGFRLFGIDGLDLSGGSVASAGDFNGDGLADLLIGAYGGDPGGESYLIFGTSEGFDASIILSALDGAEGFQIRGADGDNSGISVASAGDVNGDGYDDLIIGADGRNSATGAAYVVFGRAESPGAIFDLSSLAADAGFRLDGVGDGDYTGHSVSAAGDINGDGYGDLVVGAYYAPGDRTGATYVVYGGNRNGAVSFAGGDGDDLLTGTGGDEAFVGGRGNDTMIGGGSNEAFSGGAGDDVIGILNDGFLRVDGGAGTDTLRIAGYAVNLDLTLAGPDLIRDIEAVDLANTDSILQLSPQDLLDLSATTNTLTVEGGPLDRVVTTGVWNQQVDEGIYNVYTLGEAKLRINSAITDLLGGIGDS